ncbi:TylF/MycF/NovP-related O-methyltransferase [Hoeflea sp. AS60]|uniref:TylF/MycF/NovP-related O-methyltransferase n=1 Tax=Hoeflea sp. AS60 TaxID=3135780 RepID=UPI003182ABB1
MKRVDQLRIRQDDEIARLMTTETGQAEYWRRLDEQCNQSPLIELLEQSLRLEGDVIECGVYRGSTTRLMGRSLRQRAPSKKLFACDSFEGFPQDRILDADLGPFRFRFKIQRKFRHASDVPQRLFQFFDTYRVNGYVVKGFFSDTLPKLKPRRYCFMFIDCDIYESHLDCLNALYEQLVPGGIVVFDDYAEPKWPGASRAVDEFFADQPVKLERLASGRKALWFVRKPLATEEAAPMPERVRRYG